MSVRGLLTDRLYLSAVGILLVLVVTVAYLLSSVLDVPLTRKTVDVTVQLPSTGGLFEGSAVTYRGVKVGKVREISLSGEGVVAQVRLTKGGDRIPASTVAKVRSLSPVGEQYLDFQPRKKGGPYLQDGAVVPASATELPKTLASTVINVNRLLDQIDEKQLRTVLTELSTGLAGTGQDVGRLVDQGDLLLAELDRHWPQTERLIDNAGTVLDIAPSKADELRSLATSSKQLARFLRNYDPRLRQLLRDGPGQAKTLEELVDDATRELPGFLGAAVDFSDLFLGYEPHLRQILQLYGRGLGTLAKAIRNGNLYIQGIPQRNVRCEYGTAKRSPTETERRQLVRDGRCAGDFPRFERGAAHAPGPVD